MLQYFISNCSGQISYLEALKENLRNIEYDGQWFFFSRATASPMDTGVLVIIFCRYFSAEGSTNESSRLTAAIVFTARPNPASCQSMGQQVLGEGWQFSRRYQHFYLERR